MIACEVSKFQCLIFEVLANDDAWAAKVKALSLVVPPLNAVNAGNTEDYPDSTKFA